MKVIERMIQKSDPRGDEAVKELVARYGDLDAKWGFPPQRRYRCGYGSIAMEYVICDREWESLEIMEKTYERAMATPEWKLLMDALGPYEVSRRHELYVLEE